VDAGVEAMRAAPEADSLRAVTPAQQNPYKMWLLEHGRLRPLVSGQPDEPWNAPRQELPEALWQTGHLDVVRTSALRALRSLTGEHVLPLVVDPRYAVDIDTLEHWREAERRLQALPVVRPGGPARAPFARVRLLVFDFDGVFTDDRVYVREDGRESVACSRGDGLGLKRLREHGLRAAVLSSETNPVVAARCRKLGLHCRQGVADKGTALRVLAHKADVPLQQVAYVGNDWNDLDCLQMAGTAVAVADARPEVLAAADWVLQQRGGQGAVRELCELVIAAQAGTSHAVYRPHTASPQPPAMLRT
jgi:N-acylneuraminate cytidylyltransferase